MWGVMALIIRVDLEGMLRSLLNEFRKPYRGSRVDASEPQAKKTVSSKKQLSKSSG